MVAAAAAAATHGCRMPELDPAGVYSDPLKFPEGEESDTRQRRRLLQRMGVACLNWIQRGCILIH